MPEDRRGKRFVGVKLKGPRRFEQDSVYYVYHRATGVRMPSLPENHPDFIAAYMEAQTGTKRATKIDRDRPYALITVWHRFCTSVEFKSLSTSYQRVLHRDGDKIMSKGAEIDIRTIRAEHVRENVNSLSSHQAEQRLKTWRALMKYAKSHSLIDIDPTLAVEKPATPKAAPYLPWTADEIAAFRGKWAIGTMQRLAFELLHYTGARMSDAVRLGPGMIDNDGWLTFTQH